jgi:hypothetical protein
MSALSKLKKAQDAAKEFKKVQAIIKANKKKKDDKKLTQKGLKLSKNKDIKMPETTPKSLDTRTVSGSKGITNKGQSINIGDDVMGFNNFIKMSPSKGILNREKYLRGLEKIKREGNATQKAEATKKLERLEKIKEKSDTKSFSKQTGGRRTSTPEDDFKTAQRMLEKDGEMGAAFDRLTKNQQERLIRSAKLKKESDFSREVKAKIAEPKSAPKSVGSAVENKRRIGLNDYRKGGYVLSSVDNRKNKGK